MISPPPTSRDLPPRSAAVTALAWIVILASAALIPVSFIALLMILAGSYGTASTSLLGFASVVMAPPATLVAGLGMLRRKSWARYYLLMLLGAILACNVYGILRANCGPSRYLSPGGVPTTVLPTDWNLFVPVIAVCLAALAVLLSRRVRLEFSGAIESPSSAYPPTQQAASRELREWRVGHVGRDRMYYEEQHEGEWRRLEFEGEMLGGRAHHAVYLASPERWMSYPDWARDRRDEILARIKSEFREPDYEYAFTTGAGTPPTTVSPLSQSRHQLAALLAVILLLALAGGTAWLVYAGVGTGETVFPSKLASQRRSVSRADEPLLFWVSIGLYAAVALGCVALVAWGATQTRRNRRGHQS